MSAVGETGEFSSTFLVKYLNYLVVKLDNKWELSDFSVEDAFKGDTFFVATE